MILVTGATGTVGSQVVKQLAESGHEVTALVRDPAKAERIRHAGISIAVGDMTQPDSLRDALAGVAKVFLLAMPFSEQVMRELEDNVVDEAVKAGVEHIVKLSGTGVDMKADYPLAVWHRRGEQKVEESGIAWTHLRPSAFMTNLLFQAEPIKQQGAFYESMGDGKLPMIDPHDIAAVAVAALTETGHEGKAYTLTGPESLSQADLMAQLSDVLGRQIRYVNIPETAMRDGMIQRGVPADVVDAMVQFDRLVSAGVLDNVSTDVEQVTGRTPRTFATWARENAQAFT